MDGFRLCIIIGLLLSKIFNPPKKRIQWSVLILIWTALVLFFEFYYIEGSVPLGVSISTFRPLAPQILGFGIGFIIGLYEKKSKGQFHRAKTKI